MIAFLDCMNQLIEYAQKADKTLKLPYAYASVPSVVMGQKAQTWLIRSVPLTACIAWIGS